MINGIKQEIQRLKNKRNAIIVAHNYQLEEVQDIADFTGDSFALSKLAASTPADVIVFCGVHFMAESASLLSPDKVILLPDINAGCPLADQITPEALRNEKEKYPEAAVVCYVNSSAAVKAESHICCTSANAANVVNSLPNKQIIFVPDGNLARNIMPYTDKEMIPWDGCCTIHDQVTVEDVKYARQEHPDGVLIVHPECRPEVVKMADHVGSTSEMIRFAKETAHQKFIIGTEMGMLYPLRKENPNKEFVLLSEKLLCPDMKLINLEKIKNALENMEPQVSVESSSRGAAYKTLEGMLAN